MTTTPLGPDHWRFYADLLHTSTDEPPTDAQLVERATAATLFPSEAIDTIVTNLDAHVTGDSSSWDQPWALFGIRALARDEVDAAGDAAGVTALFDTVTRRGLASVVGLRPLVVVGDGHPADELVGCWAGGDVFGVVLVSEGFSLPLFDGDTRHELRTYLVVLADGRCAQYTRRRGGELECICGADDEMSLQGRIPLALARLLALPVRLTVDPAEAALLAFTELVVVGTRDLPDTESLLARMLQLDPFLAAVAFAHTQRAAATGDPADSTAIADRLHERLAAGQDWLTAEELVALPAQTLVEITSAAYRVLTGTGEEDARWWGSEYLAAKLITAICEPGAPLTALADDLDDPAATYLRRLLPQRRRALGLEPDPPLRPDHCVELADDRTNDRTTGSEHHD
jgi:hypothetical protein